MPGHSGSARPLLSRQRPSDPCSVLVPARRFHRRRVGAPLLCARSRALRSCEMGQRRRLNIAPHSTAAHANTRARMAMRLSTSSAVMSLQVRSPSRPSGAAAAVAYFALQICLFPARHEKVRLSMPPQEIGLPAAPPQTRPSVGAVRSGAGVTPGAQGRIGSCGETLHALTDQ